MESRIARDLYLAHFAMARRERWPADRLARHQQAAVARLRAHALRHSAFYRDFHGASPDRPFETLPVLTKATVMEHFDRLVTDRAVTIADVRRHVEAADRGQKYRRRYRVQLSSGTTGRIGVTLFDHAAWTALLSSWVRATDWAGFPISPVRRVRNASVAAVSPWATSGQITASMASWWAPTIRLWAGDPVPKIVAGLNRWQPHMLVTYASMVRILADEQRAGRLAISPRAVFSTGEVQTAEGRRLGAATWGSEPFDQYATTETGALAIECREGRQRHLMDDLNVIEVVDGDNRPVPPGTWGERVLVTPLANRVTPLIRYVLSDRIRVSDEPCSCGRTLRVLAGIDGRGEEVLRFPTGSGGEVAIDPQIYHPILDRLPVAGWQVRKDGDGLVVLLARAGAGAPGTGAAGRPGAEPRMEDGIDEAAIARALDGALTARGARVSRIDVRLVDEIARTAGGKAPVVQSQAEPSSRPSDSRSG